MIIGVLYASTLFLYVDLDLTYLKANYIIKQTTPIPDLYPEKFIDYDQESYFQLETCWFDDRIPDPLFWD